MPEILATLACGIFAGAAIYVNFVEHYNGLMGMDG
jgi:hypothetical protein